MLVILFQLMLILLFHHAKKHCQVFNIVFVMLGFFFNSLSNGKYSNIFIEAAFSNKFFSSKTFLAVKNSCLLTFPDSKAEILALCLSTLYWVLIYSILLLTILIFSLTVIFIIVLPKILMDYLMIKWYRPLKMKMVLWYNLYKALWNI